MTLKQLELFVAIADQRSFSRGAEVVHLVQSTASQHIRCLEDELGVKLFDRSKQGALLTEAGKLFVEYARRIGNVCADALVALRRFQGAEDALLRVGASTIPAACLIPDLLGGFTRQYPGIRLEISQGDSSEILRDLLNDQIELAVVGAKCGGEQLVFEQVGDEEILLVTRPADGLPHEIPVSRLDSAPLIMRERGSGTRQAIDDALLKQGVDSRSLRIVAQLGSSEAVRRAVMGGAGWGFVSSSAIARELAEGSLQAIQLVGFKIMRSFYLAQRNGRTLSPAAVLFRAALTGGIT